MRRPKLLVFLLMTSIIISATACTRIAPPDSDFSETDNDESLVHSVTRSQEMFSDDALGLQPGANAPSIFQEGKRLVVLTDRAGKTLDWLLSLVSRDWNDSVTVVGKEPLDIDAGVGWDIIENPDLITEMKTNVFPALYIVEDGIVAYRAIPTVPAFSIRLIEGLRGNYTNTTTYAENGKRLPQADLENLDGSLWPNKIQRNTVFVLVDTSCFVCAPAALACSYEQIGSTKYKRTCGACGSTDPMGPDLTVATTTYQNGDDCGDLSGVIWDQVEYYCGYLSGC